MSCTIQDIPQEIIDKYKLYELNLVHNGFVFVEIWKALFGLNQSGVLANTQISKVFEKEGYFQSEHTSGLWVHKTRYISFILVMDDFGVKYTKKEDVIHLQSIIKKLYPTTTNWIGNRYLGVHLDWNYKIQELKASISSYRKKTLLQFQHEAPIKT